MTDQSKHRALLARLEAERAHHEECTALSRVDEGRIAHSGMAAGLHIAAIRVVEEFQGREAAAEYMRRTTPGRTEPAPTPASDAGLREQYMAAILRGGGCVDLAAATDAVLAVRARHMEQLAARVAELEQQVAEAAEDYAQLENHTDATCEAVQRRDAAEAALARVREYVATSDDDGIRTRETVLRLLGGGAALTPAQRLQRTQVERLLGKVRRNGDEAERDRLAAVLREVLDQFADWPKGGSLWPDGGVVAKVSAEDWDRWYAAATASSQEGA
ncbi:hypothetical protein ACFV4E_22745 [Streptomyces hygroscopicus]|uniref:hypothetical protein n=1 Tax=Streptomyces hygroscopicus TaxID=1912 RepID=UPI0033DE6680